MSDLNQNQKRTRDKENKENDDETKQLEPNTKEAKTDPVKVFLEVGPNANASTAKAWLRLNFVEPEEEKELFQYFQKHIPFIRHILYAGTDRERKQARLSCSMGAAYAYSGSVHPESPWDQKVLEIMNRINAEYGTQFNSCLINYYQNGSEYISAHSDDERRLDRNGLVLSLSFGSERVMTIRSKTGAMKPLLIPLPPGSLFAMEGPQFQKLFTHGIDRCSPKVGPRISLTFRRFM